MIKRSILLLLILSVVTTTYPLTDTDWRVINSLTYGVGAVGAVGGALAGHRIGGATGPLLPSIFMKSTSTELLFDPTKQLQEKMVKEQMKHRPSLYGKIFGTTLGGFAGMELGKFGGEKLAILYIARKYGVSLNEAWLAIRLNRDLSKKIKK